MSMVSKLISEEIMAENFLIWQRHNAKESWSSEKLKQNKLKEIQAQAHWNQITGNWGQRKNLESSLRKWCITYCEAMIQMTRYLIRNHIM